jgi:hypothetical protein
LSDACISINLLKSATSLMLEGADGICKNMYFGEGYRAEDGGSRE